MTATVALANEEQGRRNAPAVLLAPSLGTTRAMWDGLAARLAERYRVVRFDTRGHGDSPVPPGSYSVSELAADVIALADRLRIDRFALVGLSLGGAIGQALALEHPDRLNALVLCCTGPSFGDPQGWRDRAAQVRAEGMGFLAEPTKERWFTPAFREAHPTVVEEFIAMITSTPAQGYAGCCDALEAYDVTVRLGEIAAPTRVIAGAQDPVSPPGIAELMVDRIPAAPLVVHEGASHIANVARPDEFDAAVLAHLGRHL
jgi:3-oxoadipate enol-lactonase